MTFHRLISKLSVRTRIITIAFIPVLGLLANGLAFTSGETEVQSAFGSVGEANALADASRDFKGAVHAMRASTVDFAARPSRELIKSFQDAHALSLNSLATLEALVAASEKSELSLLSHRVQDLLANFNLLISEQQSLGFSESEGIRARMQQAARPSSASSARTCRGCASRTCRNSSSRSCRCGAMRSSSD
jgi:methyl-accepting chemotaxis protein